MSVGTDAAGAREARAPEKACRLQPVIAIDGPAGAGKSTIAQAVALRLGFVYLDSGALYRGVAVGLDQGAGQDPAAIHDQLPRLDLEGLPGRGGFAVRVQGDDVTRELRDPPIGEAASALAADPVVRRYVGERLRRIAAAHPCVAEGRDMGTVVFPDAALKIFLTASLAERARRRCAQVRAQGREADEEQVRAALVRRDARDSTRAASPLRAAADAVRIDNTRLAPDAQVALIIAFFRGRGRLPGRWTQRLLKAIGRALFRGLFGLRVEGREHLPRGAFLLASNHRSYLDPPVLGASIPGRMGYLAKRELFAVPLLGALIRELDAIPLNRRGADRRGLAAALAALAQGMPLVVFPEGTRVRGEHLGKPHAGIALLARRSGVPVVPAHLSGTDRPGAALLRRRPMVLRLGPPLQPPAPDDGAGDAAYVGLVMESIGRLGVGATDEGAC
ncbi:MAG: (d)CMP kinase [Candidatus Eisenbacteria sp.]|nr:(d)CMP kinase [Candidatus Eisenbacteria bacterium]